MSAQLQRVRSFWEDHVNNEYYTQHDRSSPAYFQEIEQRRYKFHYHLPVLFDRIRAQGTEGKRLLELGCGIGIDTLRLAKLGFEEVVGADLTETAIAIASERAERESISNVRFTTANAENLDFEDGSFDTVYSFGVIHHTADIGEAVAEIHRVLTPGGRAHIMIYHRRSLVAAVHELFRLPYESPRDLKDRCPVVLRHSKDEAERLFSRFADIDIHADYPFTFGMRYISWMFPVTLQRRLGRWIGWHLMIEARKA